MIIGSKDKPRHYKNCSDPRFLITPLCVGSASVVNGPVIFLAKGKKVHPRLRGNNLVTTYGLTEGSCVIPTKSAYMDDETCPKVVKLVSPGIRKTQVSNFASFLPIILSIYLTLHICPYKLSVDDM